MKPFTRWSQTTLFMTPSNFNTCSPQAWSNIVHLLIPNVHYLESSLTNFATILDADEVLLFERATFLVSSIHSLPPEVKTTTITRLLYFWDCFVCVGMSLLNFYWEQNSQIVFVILVTHLFSQVIVLVCTNCRYAFVELVGDSPLSTKTSCWYPPVWEDQ